MSERSSLPGGLIVFKVGERELCLDIRFLAAILNPREKESHEFVSRDDKGCIKYDNGEYPLINFVSLPEKDSPDNDNTRIILVEYKNRRCSFVVDKISEIIYRDIDGDDLFKFVPAKDAPGFSGYIEFGGRNLWLLDIDECLSLPPPPQSLTK